MKTVQVVVVVVAVVQLVLVATPLFLPHFSYRSSYMHCTMLKPRLRFALRTRWILEL